MSRPLCLSYNIDGIRGGSLWMSVAKKMSIMSADLKESEVIDLVKELYNLDVIAIQKLVGYTDKNFHIQVSNSGPDTWPHGYTLKVLNLEDSSQPALIDGMIKMMDHLNSNVICTPTAIHNIHGSYKHSVKFRCVGKDGDEAMLYVILLRFIPGTLFKDVPYDNELFFRSGMMTAKMHQSLINFTDDGIEARDILWSLSHLPRAKKFLHLITDDLKKEVFSKTIEEFESRVLKNQNKLTTGIIHGDLNEFNILLSKKHEDSSYEWCGLLDYGDVNKSYVVFDFGILLAYIMGTSKNLDPIIAAGHAVAGYLQQHPLSALEFNLILLCIKGRLAQTLILGAYSYSLDPANKYILTSHEDSWNLLKNLFNLKDSEVYSKWNQILFDFDIHAPK